MERASKKFISTQNMEWEELGGGVSRKFLGYDNQIMMVHVKFEKGALGSPHQHFHTQATFCVSGKFEFEIDGEKKIVEAEMEYTLNQICYTVLFALKKGC